MKELYEYNNMSVTVVSTYYKIPSKQPHSFYREHLRRWFRAISVPVIFFTTPDIQYEIEEFGFSLEHVRFIHLPFNDLVAWSKWGRAFWEKQCDIDPEKYHTPELAAIWYEKKEFVKRAMSLSAADVFIWCDAGCVRNDASEHAMQTFCKRGLYPSPGKLLLQKLQHIPQREFYTYPDSCIAGSIQIGDREAWASHIINYDTILQLYDKSDISGNSDQYITLSLSNIYPNMYEYQLPPPNLYIDRWFFMLQCF